MTVELTKGTYILGMWYAEFPSNKGNLMACVTKVDNKWQLQYRFRYYKDDIVGPESNDKKSWYEGGLKDGEIPENKVFDTVETVFKQLYESRHTERHEFFPVYGDAQWFGELLANGGGPKWMHSHLTTPEEIKQYGLEKKEG